MRLILKLQNCERFRRVETNSWIRIKANDLNNNFVKTKIAKHTAKNKIELSLTLS